MSASFAYHGRYLRIDLTDRSVRTVELPGEVLRRYIGGSGLGTWILLNEAPDYFDALSPQAPLVFVFSPLVGSPLTTSAKFAVVSKSPLTNRINDALSSSHFAISGKKTGYDALVIVGASEEPALVRIDDAGVRFEGAHDEWGLTVPETARALKQRFGSRYRSAVIGPAGEQGVRFASVSHDGRHAGRGGTGAVMGAKRLKAICVYGTKSAEFAHPQELADYSRRLSKESLGDATAKYRELGTVSNLLAFNRLGTLPTRNFQSGSFAGAEAIAPEAISAARSRTRESCAACTIGCEHIFELPPNGSPTPAGVRMEYENLFAFGPLCGVSDPDVVLKASRYCDDVGMDTVSAGGAIAFAMECAERGLIDEPDLRFGNSGALLPTLRAISSRRGIGELLAFGTRAAAEAIGGDSHNFAPHVKGLEIPGYEPRALHAMALGFAVGARGADHNRSGAYQFDFSEAAHSASISDTVSAAIATENEAAIMDSLILCKFLRGVFDDRLAAMGAMLSLVTGWDIDATELQGTAARIVTAKKWFNINQGWSPEEDMLPARFFEESLSGGVTDGLRLNRERLNEMIVAYNLERGWTPDGWIPDNIVAALTARASAHANH